jgi:hypothetical protein
VELGKKLLFRCQGYCSNFVIPIKVGKDVIGYLYSGQFYALKPKDDDESKEWDRLTGPGSEYHVEAKDGKYIHGHFFLNSQNRPKKTDLIAVAEENNIVTEKEIEDFIGLYQKESNPETSSSVKSAVEVLRDIKILSEIANVISVECNTKYALKTHFEVSQRIKEMKRKKISKKRIETNYVNLCNKIEELLKNLKKIETNPPLGHCQMIDEIDTSAIEILKIIKEQERHHLQNKIWLKNLIFLLSISKKDEFKKLIEPTNPKSPNIKPSLKQQKQELIQQIDKIKEDTKIIDKLWSLVGPITWILVILAIIGLIFMVIR